MLYSGTIISQSGKMLTQQENKEYGKNSYDKAQKKNRTHRPRQQKRRHAGMGKIQHWHLKVT
jgi:hypothetical protein